MQRLVFQVYVRIVTLTKLEFLQLIKLSLDLHNIQVCKLEQDLQKEKTTWQEELALLEKKLSQVCTELENKNAQIQEMTNSVK